MSKKNNERSTAVNLIIARLISLLYSYLNFTIIYQRGVEKRNFNAPLVINNSCTISAKNLYLCDIMYDLELLAGIACMFVTNFVRVFKDTYRATPVDYLIQLRVRKAREMLQNLDKSITSVASRLVYRTGITSPGLFAGLPGGHPVNTGKTSLDEMTGNDRASMAAIII